MYFLKNFIFSPWTASPAASPWHLLGSRGAPGCTKTQAYHSAQALFKLLAQSLQSCPELTGYTGSAAPCSSKCKGGETASSISFSFTLHLPQIHRGWVAEPGAANKVQQQPQTWWGPWAEPEQAPEQDWVGASGDVGHGHWNYQCPQSCDGSLIEF